jgi:hypothetical protein
LERSLDGFNAAHELNVVMASIAKLKLSAKAR